MADECIQEKYKKKGSTKSSDGIGKKMRLSVEHRPSGKLVAYLNHMMAKINIQVLMCQCKHENNSLEIWLMH